MRQEDALHHKRIGERASGPSPKREWRCRSVHPIPSRSDPDGSLITSLVAAAAAFLLTRSRGSSKNERASEEPLHGIIIIIGDGNRRRLSRLRHRRTLHKRDAPAPSSSAELFLSFAFARPLPSSPSSLRWLSALAIASCPAHMPHTTHHDETRAATQKSKLDDLG